MCNVTNVEFTANEDIKVFKSVRVKSGSGSIISRYPPSGRSAIEHARYQPMDRGVEVHYVVGRRITSPGGPGLMSFLQRRDAENSASSPARINEYAVLECTIPKGFLVRVVIDAEGLMGFATQELEINRAYKAVY